MNESLPIAFLLPYPPSDNRRYIYGTKALTDETRGFRNTEVFAMMRANQRGIPRIDERFQAVVYCYPCNKRRDILNCCKELWDSLQKNGLYRDDNALDEARVIRCQWHPSDLIIVELWPVDAVPDVVKDMTPIQRMKQRDKDDRFNNRVYAAPYVWKFIKERKKIVQK